MSTSGTPNGKSTLLKKFQVPYLFRNKSWNKVFPDLLSKNVLKLHCYQALKNEKNYYLVGQCNDSGTSLRPLVLGGPTLLLTDCLFCWLDILLLQRGSKLWKKTWKLPLISTLGALFWEHHPPHLTHRTESRLNVGLLRLASSSHLL